MLACMHAHILHKLAGKHVRLAPVARRRIGRVVRCPPKMDVEVLDGVLEMLGNTGHEVYVKRI